MKKKCVNCGVEKDVSSFCKNKTYTSGYDNKCKDCRRSQKLIHREKIRLSNLKKEIAYKNKNEEFRNKDMTGEDIHKAQEERKEVLIKKAQDYEV